MQGLVFKGVKGIVQQKANNQKSNTSGVNFNLSFDNIAPGMGKIANAFAQHKQQNPTPASAYPSESVVNKPQNLSHPQHSTETHSKYPQGYYPKFNSPYPSQQFQQQVYHPNQHQMYNNFHHQQQSNPNKHIQRSPHELQNEIIHLQQQRGLAHASYIQKNSEIQHLKMVIHYKNEQIKIYEKILQKNGMTPAGGYFVYQEDIDSLERNKVQSSTGYTNSFALNADTTYPKSMFDDSIKYAQNEIISLNQQIAQKHIQQQKIGQQIQFCEQRIVQNQSQLAQLNQQSLQERHPNPPPPQQFAPMHSKKELLERIQFLETEILTTQSKIQVNNDKINQLVNLDVKSVREMQNIMSSQISPLDANNKALTENLNEMKSELTFRKEYLNQVNSIQAHQNQQSDNISPKFVPIHSSPPPIQHLFSHQSKMHHQTSSHSKTNTASVSHASQSISKDEFLNNFIELHGSKDNILKHYQRTHTHKHTLRTINTFFDFTKRKIDKISKNHQTKRKNQVQEIADFMDNIKNSDISPEAKGVLIHEKMTEVKDSIKEKKSSRMWNYLNERINDLHMNGLDASTDPSVNEQIKSFKNTQNDNKAKQKVKKL